MTNQSDLNQVSDDDLGSASGGAYIDQNQQVVETSSLEKNGMVGSGAPTRPIAGANGHGINPMVDKDGNAWGEGSMGDIYIKSPETGEMKIYRKSGEY